MGVRRLAKMWLERVFRSQPRYISRDLHRHKMVTCNKDVSIYLAGFEIPYVVDHLTKQILTHVDTPLLFRQPGLTDRRQEIGEHFLRHGTLPPDVADDVHEACALYKRWLRSLRQPLLPLDVQRRLIQRLNAVDDPEEWQLLRLAELVVVDGDSRPHLPLVCFIHCIYFLQHIARFRSRNFMSSRSLAGAFVRDFFCYEALELHWPRIGNQSQDERDYHAQQERVLRRVIEFLEYLLSGRGNRVFSKALRRRAERQKAGHVSSLDILPPPRVEFEPRAHHLPVIPIEARAALARSSEPILLMWRSHDFDTVPVRGEGSPLRMTYLPNNNNNNNNNYDE